MLTPAATAWIDQPTDIRGRRHQAPLSLKSAPFELAFAVHRELNLLETIGHEFCNAPTRHCSRHVPFIRTRSCISNSRCPHRAAVPRRRFAMSIAVLEQLAGLCLVTLTLKQERKNR
jgi:hypothetical protein